VLEWRSASDELVCQYAQAPYVNSLVVASMAAREHLWRQVVSRAAESLASSRWSMHTPPKVSKFYYPITVEKVFRLEVSMDHVFGVHVDEAVYDLRNVIGCLRLRVALLHLQVVEQLTFDCILQNQVDSVFIIEEPVHSQDVWVVQMRLDLHFALKLLDEIILEQLLFVQYLDCTNELGPLLACQIDLAKLATTQRQRELEIIYAPVLRVKALLYMRRRWLDWHWLIVRGGQIFSGTLLIFFFLFRL